MDGSSSSSWSSPSSGSNEASAPLSAFVVLRTLIIALAISGPVYGTFVAQAMQYYSSNRYRTGDRLAFKVLVGALMVLNPAHLLLNLADAVMVLKTALSPTYFFYAPGPVGTASDVILVVIAVSVSAFFTLRAYGLYPTWKVPAVAGVLMLFSTTANIILVTYYGLVDDDFKWYGKANLWLKISSWSNFAFEAFVGTILLLRLHRTGELKIRPHFDPVMQILVPG